MSKRTDHDELIEMAARLIAASPQAGIARVQLLARNEADSLQRALANQLHRRGVMTSKERDALDTVFDEDELMEYTQDQLLEQVHGPTAEDLAARVATFQLSPDSELLTKLNLDGLAGRLFEATFEAARLKHLLDNRNPAIAFVRTLTVTDDGHPRTQLWRSLGGPVIVQLTQPDATSTPTPAQREVKVFPSDTTGKILSPQQPMIVGTTTVDNDGPVTEQDIRDALRPVTPDWDFWWIPISW